MGEFLSAVYSLLSNKLWPIRKDDIPKQEKTEDVRTIFWPRASAWSALIVMRPSFPTTPARIAGIIAVAKCCWWKNRHKRQG